MQLRMAVMEVHEAKGEGEAGEVHRKERVRREGWTARRAGGEATAVATALVRDKVAAQWRHEKETVYTYLHNRLDSTASNSLSIKICFEFTYSRHDLFNGCNRPYSKTTVVLQNIVNKDMSVGLIKQLKWGLST